MGPICPTKSQMKASEVVKERLQELYSRSENLLNKMEKLKPIMKDMDQNPDETRLKETYPKYFQDLLDLIYTIDTNLKIMSDIIDRVEF